MVDKDDGSSSEDDSEISAERIAQNRMARRKGSNKKFSNPSIVKQLQPIEEQELDLEQSVSFKYSIKPSRKSFEATDSPVRCLLVNDDPFILFSAKQTLSRHFTEVDSKMNGKLAVDAVLARGPFYYKVIILDINMPVMDGIEACIKIT